MKARLGHWYSIKSVPKDGTPVLLLCEWNEGKEKPTVELRRYDKKAAKSPSFNYGPFVWVNLCKSNEGDSIAERIPYKWSPVKMPKVLRKKRKR